MDAPCVPAGSPHETRPRIVDLPPFHCRPYGTSFPRRFGLGGILGPAALLSGPRDCLLFLTDELHHCGLWRRGDSPFLETDGRAGSDNRGAAIWLVHGFHRRLPLPLPRSQREGTGFSRSVTRCQLWTIGIELPGTFLCRSGLVHLEEACTHLG